MTHVNRLSYIVFVVRKTHDYWSLGFAWSLLLFITLVRMGILNFAVEASTSISKHWHMAGWYSGYHSCFVIWKSQVQILITAHAAYGEEFPYLDLSLPFPNRAALYNNSINS